MRTTTIRGARCFGRQICTGTDTKSVTAALARLAEQFAAAVASVSVVAPLPGGGMRSFTGAAA